MKQVFQNRHFVLLITILPLAALFNFIASNIIETRYPDRPIVPDLLFDTLPHIGWTQHISDPLTIFSSLIFICYVFRYPLQRIIPTLIGNTFIYAVRGLSVSLTPMGKAYDYGGGYGIFSLINITQAGMFPSGHTALAYYMYLFIEPQNKILKHTYLILLIAQIVVLILSRGHYSIDIVGGLMTGYIAYRLSQDYLASQRKTAQQKAG